MSGCGGDPKPAVQYVAACVGPSPSHPEGSQVSVELRLGTEVVASGRGPVGSTIGGQVPLGEVSVYADDVLVGSVGSPTAPVIGEDGRPAETAYFSQLGCPDLPPDMTGP
jgi:hypothetical protein